MEYTTSTVEFEQGVQCQCALGNGDANANAYLLPLTVLMAVVAGAVIAIQYVLAKRERKRAAIEKEWMLLNYETCSRKLETCSSELEYLLKMRTHFLLALNYTMAQLDKVECAPGDFIELTRDNLRMHTWLIDNNFTESTQKHLYQLNSYMQSVVDADPVYIKKYLAKLDALELLLRVSFPPTAQQPTVPAPLDE